MRKMLISPRNSKSSYEWRRGGCVVSGQFSPPRYLRMACRLAEGPSTARVVLQTNKLREFKECSPCSAYVGGNPSLICITGITATPITFPEFNAHFHAFRLFCFHFSCTSSTFYFLIDFHEIVCICINNIRCVLKHVR